MRDCCICFGSHSKAKLNVVFYSDSFKLREVSYPSIAMLQCRQYLWGPVLHYYKALSRFVQRNPLPKDKQVSKCPLFYTDHTNENVANLKIIRYCDATTPDINRRVRKMRESLMCPFVIE